MPTMSTTLIIPPYIPAAVLEVNAGDAQKYNIKVGDVIRYKWFPTETKPLEVSDNSADENLNLNEEENSTTEEAESK